jgi:hypothetical protein
LSAGALMEICSSYVFIESPLRGRRPPGTRR